MSVSIKKVATRVSFVLAAAALFVPVTVTSDDGVVENEVCAGSACCPEWGSFCGVENPQIDHYFSASGDCKREDAG